MHHVDGMRVKSLVLYSTASLVYRPLRQYGLKKTRRTKVFRFFVTYIVPFKLLLLLPQAKERKLRYTSTEPSE